MSCYNNRSGTGLKNPCALSVGQDWTLGVNTSFSWRSHLLPNETIYPPSYPRIGASFIRNRALAFRDIIEIKIPGLSNRQPEGGICHVFAEKGAKYGEGINPAKNSTSTALENFTSSTACETFMTEVYINHTDKPTHAWESYWDVRRNILSIVVGTPVPSESKVEVFVHGFHSTTIAPSSEATVDCAGGTIECQSSMETIADVLRAQKTTVLFKNLATYSSYTTKWGDPLQGYTETPHSPPATTGLAISPSAIYNFRVYAYNGRYKSKSVQTLVQNRAIQRPAKPLYFPQVDQENFPVELMFTMPAGQQSSNPTPGVASPIRQSPGLATRVGVKFTPTRLINELETLDLHLPKFTGPGFLNINNDAANLILAHRFQPYGSPECQCDSEGRVLTPRNNYKVVRSATGSFACNHTENNSTLRITGVKPPDGNISAPSCACGDCACSLSGQPITPAPLYNVTGNCTTPHPDGICGCDENGNVFTPKVTYNVTYNETSGDVLSSVPRICSCECPVFLKCACNCELYATHTCGCHQNQPDPVFQNASWSSYAETLVLTVGPQKQLPAFQEAVVWISSGAGITMPADGSYPVRPDGVPGLDALLMRFKLNWVSPFPSLSTPRLGFIIQFTSDLFWKTNVQTVVLPDNLDGGIVVKEVVAILAEPTTQDGEQIILRSPARYLEGRYIQIEDEIMRVIYANATHPHLQVRRGQFSTARAVHTIANGGADCGCHINGSTIGNPPCQCNGVGLLVMGATDLSIGGGLDFKTGFEGVKCRAGSDFVDEGCNIQGHIFPHNIRLHQSAIISGKVTPSLNFATACSGTASTCTSGNCQCGTPTLVQGGEFANQRPRGNTSIVSPGNVMEYPLDYRTRLTLAAAATFEVNVLAVGDTAQLVGKYIRVGSEIMFGLEASLGVLSVSPFQASGTASGGGRCSCSVTGVSSGGGTCACFGSLGRHCTAGGTLFAIGGGGRDFKATVTVSGGQIASITVDSPGIKYAAPPDIKWLTGGTNCSSDIIFYPTMTQNTLRVARAQLGTSLGAHGSNVIVNTVLWPSQSDPYRPGRRYNFRIAAYNSAGFSDFAYFDMKLYAVQPRVLPAAGGAIIEILLVGGGMSSKGYTVYIGRLKVDGSVDLQKSKVCDSLVNLDLAGTRIRCKTPSWVGGQFDLIVHYKSGVFEQLATGNGWMKYAPPEITRIMPAMLDPAVPKVPVVVTVFGKNFGLDSGDIRGELVGATIIPCRPLVVVTDSELLCTLTPQLREDKLEGDIVITAGNETFHGKGQETKPGESSKLREKPQPIEVTATIQASFDEVTSSPSKTAEFKATFTNDVAKAAKISPSLINVTDIKPGSVVVLFQILPDVSSSSAPSPAAVAMDLAVQAADPKSALRQGALTSSVSVALPVGVQEAAGKKSTTAGAVPKYLSTCEPKSYSSSLDMKRCYTCCNYLCQTGPEVPQVGGTDVLPGFRPKICQSLCLIHVRHSLNPPAPKFPPSCSMCVRLWKL